jgi:hypothetical protein
VNIAPEHISMALEWIDDLEILSDAGKRLLKELGKEHLLTHDWLDSESLYTRLSDVPPDELEAALDDLTMLGLVALSDSDDVDEDTNYYRLAPHLGFDLDSTLSEVIRSESEEP